MSVTCQLLTADFPALPRPNRRIPAKSGRGLAGKAVTLLIGTGETAEITGIAFARHEYRFPRARTSGAIKIWPLQRTVVIGIQHAVIVIIGINMVRNPVSIGIDANKGEQRL